MSSIAALFFATASVAFLSHRPRGLALASGLASAVACIAAAIAAFGGLRGVVVALVLAMTVASVLVFVLPVRRELSKPLALASTVLGAGAGALALLGGEYA